MICQAECFGKLRKQSFGTGICMWLEHDADYQAADITYDKYGHASFSVLRNGVKVGSYYLKVPGIHNVSNALAAIALGHLLGLSEEVIIKGLGSFTLHGRSRMISSYFGVSALMISVPSAGRSSAKRRKE